MLKALLALAIVAGLGWYAYTELDLGNAKAPTGPSVQYPNVDAGDSVGGVGESVGGVLGG